MSCQTTNRIEGIDSGRDENGRFVAGNKGGPGNPFGRYTAQLRVALLAAITEEDMQAVARKLIEQAVAGSLPAIKLLLQYAIGKPTNAPNPDHVEIDEWNYFTKTAEMSDDVGKVLKSLEPEVVLDMGREVRPILSELAATKFARAFETGDASVLHKKEPPSSDGCDGPAGGEAPGTPPSANDANGDRRMADIDDGPPSPDGLNGGAAAGDDPPTAAAPSPIGCNGGHGDHAASP